MLTPGDETTDPAGKELPYVLFFHGYIIAGACKVVAEHILSPLCCMDEICLAFRH